MKSLLRCNIYYVSEVSSFADEVRNSIKRNSIVLLSGDLAAGKTTFVSYFCKLFNLEFVQSPTYALHQRYSNSNVIIDHFDLYRLTTEEEIQSSGFYDQVNMPSSYKFIEWPERISREGLPLGVVQYLIEFRKVSEHERIVELFLLSE